MSDLVNHVILLWEFHPWGLLLACLKKSVVMKVDRTQSTRRLLPWRRWQVPLQRPLAGSGSFSLISLESGGFSEGVTFSGHTQYLVSAPGIKGFWVIEVVRGGRGGEWRAERSCSRYKETLVLSSSFFGYSCHISPILSSPLPVITKANIYVWLRGGVAKWLRAWTLSLAVQGWVWVLASTS